MRRFAKGTTASYKTKSDEWKCDLDRLAKVYSEYTNVPSYINDKRAMEIALLAKSFLRYRKIDRFRYHPTAHKAEGKEGKNAHSNT